MRVNRLTDNFRVFSLRGMIVGDLLWLLAIGFVFANRHRDRGVTNQNLGPQTVVRGQSS
jgi:hypothetical protein